MDASSRPCDAPCVRQHAQEYTVSETNRVGVTGMPANKPGLFFYGVNPANQPYGDGTLCVAGPLKRIEPPAISNAAGILENQVDLGLHGLSSLASGDVRRFQLWYRDPQGGFNGFTFSSALEVTFCP